MKKNLLLITLIVLSIICVAGCSKKKNDIEIAKPKESEEEVTPEIAGGYTYDTAVAGTLPENAQKAFDEAIEDLDGVSYTPLACLGTQVVAGTNYAIITKSTAITPQANAKLTILFIYDALDEKAKITSTKDFVLSDYITNEVIKNDNVGLFGGWNVPTEGGLYSMPQELASATSEALSNYKDMAIEPLACLGSQVVAGTNYALISREKTNEENTQLGLYIVVINNDLENNAKVLSVSSLDITKLKED